VNAISEHEDLAAFKAAAEHFCAVVESAESRTRADLLFDLGVALPALYVASLRLPDWDSETEESERLTRDPFGDVYGPLRDVLGDHGEDGFWAFVNHMDGVDEPRRIQFWKKDGQRHDIFAFADDLAELYLVLKNGLTLAGSGFEEEAVWEWRLHWFLWGTYITRSLTTLHACLVAEAARSLVRDGPDFPVPPSPDHS
jgi:hypothetical protein